VSYSITLLVDDVFPLGFVYAACLPARLSMKIGSTDNSLYDQLQYITNMRTVPYWLCSVHINYCQFHLHATIIQLVSCGLSWSKSITGIQVVPHF